MPRAVLYSEAEGGYWRMLPKEIYVSSMMAREIEVTGAGCKPTAELGGLTVAGLLFDDGSRWDAVIGFVPDAQTAASVAEIIAGLKGS